MLQVVALVAAALLFGSPRVLAGPEPGEGRVEGALDAPTGADLLLFPGEVESMEPLAALAPLVPSGGFSLRGINAFSPEAREVLRAAQEHAAGGAAPHSAESRALQAPESAIHPHAEQPGASRNGDRAPLASPSASHFLEQEINFGIQQQLDVVPGAPVETVMEQAKAAGRPFDGSAEMTAAAIAEAPSLSPALPAGRENLTGEPRYPALPLSPVPLEKPAEESPFFPKDPAFREAYAVQKQILTEFDQAEAAGLTTIEIDDKSLSLTAHARAEVSAEEIYDARNLARLLRPYTIFLTKLKVTDAVLRHLTAHMTAEERADFLRTRRLISVEEFGRLHDDLNISLSEELMRDDNAAVRERIVQAVAELREEAVREESARGVELKPDQVPVKIAPFIAGPAEWALSADLNARGVRTTVDGPLNFAFFEDKSIHRRVFQYVREENPELNLNIAQGFEQIHSMEELVRAAVKLAEENPELEAVFAKLNKGVSGLGNRKVELPKAEDLAEGISKEDLHRLIMQTLNRMRKNPQFQDYLDEMRKTGAVLEEFMGWVPDSPAPSVQVRVRANGEVDIRSTADQVLKNGVFMGGAMPADLRYRSAIAEIGKAVGRVLHQMGYIGYFGIDFQIKEGKPSFEVFGIEINSRETGMFHALEAAMWITGVRPDGEGGLILPDARSLSVAFTDHAMIPGLVGLKGLFAGDTEDEKFLDAMTLPDSLVHLILGSPRKGNFAASFWSVESMSAAERGLRDVIDGAERFAMARTQRRSGGPLLAEDAVVVRTPKQPAIAILAANRVERNALLEAASRLFPGEFILVTNEDWLTRERRSEVWTQAYEGWTYDPRKDRIVKVIYGKRLPDGTIERIPRQVFVFNFVYKTRDRLRIRARAFLSGVKVPETLVFLGPRYPGLGVNLTASQLKELQRKIKPVAPDKNVRAALSEWLRKHQDGIGDQIVVHTNLDEDPQVFTAETLKTPGAPNGPKSFATSEQIAQIADYVAKLRERVGDKGAVVVESAVDPLFLRVKAIRRPGDGVEFSVDRKIYSSSRDPKTQEVRLHEEDWATWLKFYNMNDQPLGAADTEEQIKAKERYAQLKEEIKTAIRQVLAANPREYALDLDIGIWQYADDDARPLMPVFLRIEAENDPTTAGITDEMRGDLERLRGEMRAARLRDRTPVLDALASIMAEVAHKEHLRRARRVLSRRDHGSGSRAMEE